MLLESGHAYRMTHLQHHRLFPSHDDPEGYPAHLCFLGAVLLRTGVPGAAVVVGLPARRGRPRPARLAAGRGGVPPSSPIAGVLLWPVTPALLVYAVMAIVGSWVYPLLTVYLPHHDYGDEPLTQTRTLRGRLIPAMFLELTYHLEHHLYPPGPQPPPRRTGPRLDPLFEKAGVETWRVP